MYSYYGSSTYLSSRLRLFTALRANPGQICASTCHAAITGEFQTSVVGNGVMEDMEEARTATCCGFNFRELRKINRDRNYHLVYKSISKVPRQCANSRNTEKNCQGAKRVAQASPNMIPTQYSIPFCHCESFFRLGEYACILC